MSILKFHKFLEQETSDLSLSNDEVKSDVINNIKNNLKEFNQKKSIMEQIFKNSDDLKLEDDLKSKVYSGQIDLDKRNRYLKSYESILRIERMVRKIEESILENEDKKNDINLFIRGLRSKLGEVDKSNVDKINKQISKNNDYLKRIDDSIKSSKSKIIEYKSKLVDSQKTFKKMMDEELHRIKNV